MEKEEIKARLKNCSMICFVNCFKRAWEKWEKNDVLTNYDILECDSRLEPKATHPIDKDEGLKTRCYGINEIFRGGGQFDALQICISANIKPKKAKEWLGRYS